jgi:uncharacterized protein (TIGR03083 family)
MSVNTAASSVPLAGAPTEASRIQPLSHAEAGALAQAVFDRFVLVLERLEPDDWHAPTYCTEWTVRDIVAHETGGYESGTSFAAFRRQWFRLPERGRSLLDSVNAAQIRARAGRTPAELIAELRDVGPRALAARRTLSPLVRRLPMPVPPMGLRRVGFLTDDIYLRDGWIHTVDICHATNRPLALTAALDGRIVALVVQDLAPRLAKALAGATVAFDLGGPAGGCYRIGPAAAPDATIRMDAVDFALRTSERITVEQALARSQVAGDGSLARRALEHSFVLY